MAAGATSGNAEEWYGQGETAEQQWSTPSIQRVTRQNNILPIWRSSETMNLNHLILENINISPYFKNKLSTLKTYQEVIDELYYNVGHLEPWERGTHKTAGQTGMCGGVRGVGAGGVVSTPFCILFKLFTMKLTRKQLVTTINHPDSPYIRALGFMYVRFCQPPETFWEWFEPYFDDEEEVDPKAGGGDNMTMGQLVKLLLTKLDWYGTLFPRIPVPVQKEIDQKLREYNMKKFEDAKRDREAQEAAERPQKPEPDEIRKEDRRSPRKYESRRNERSKERGGSRRRSRSRSKRSRSRSKPSHSRSRHSHHRSGSASRSRHSRNRRSSRSRSPKRSAVDERRPEGKNVQSRSRSPDTKRHSSSRKHDHKKHKHRRHHRHHRRHRSRDKKDRKDESKGSSSRSTSRERRVEKEENGKRIQDTQPEDKTKLHQNRKESGPDVNSESSRNGSKSTDPEPGEITRNEDDTTEEGELADDPSS